MRPGRLRSDPFFRGSLSEGAQPVKGQGGQGRRGVCCERKGMGFRLVRTVVSMVEIWTWNLLGNY